ncbi:hypothetical protein OROGR_028113 [Orobanche gracilis]
MLSTTTAATKLKAFQLEQSQSSRKAQVKKEQSLRSLSQSIYVWLNFLLQYPTSCGCHSSIADATPATEGKRDGRSWSRGGGKEIAAADSSFSQFMDSLKDVCSFDDLKQRMVVYLSLGTCEDVFQMMTQITKAIDEGMLNMKAHCPVVTDLGLKDKATRILMCYNPVWLRIGLQIVFGGDSLVLNRDVDSDQDVAFLKMVIGKMFFSHEGLAKVYAYNKMVEGI